MKTNPYAVTIVTMIPVILLLLPIKPLVDVSFAQVVNLPDILFASGRAELTAEGQAKVRQIATVLNGVALGRHVSVEGHTDSFEKDAQALSEARARAVARALIAERVSESRISKIRGYGSRYPIAPNADRAGRANPAGQAKNRRVEVVIEN